MALGRTKPSIIMTQDISALRNSINVFSNDTDSIDNTNAIGATALILATQNIHRDIVETLINHGANGGIEVDLIFNEIIANFTNRRANVDQVGISGDESESDSEESF